MSAGPFTGGENFYRGPQPQGALGGQKPAKKTDILGLFWVLIYAIRILKGLVVPFTILRGPS